MSPPTKESSRSKRPSTSAISDKTKKRTRASESTKQAALDSSDCEIDDNAEFVIQPVPYELSALDKNDLLEASQAAVANLNEYERTVNTPGLGLALDQPSTRATTSNSSPPSSTFAEDPKNFLASSMSSSNHQSNLEKETQLLIESLKIQNKGNILELDNYPNCLQEFKIKELAYYLKLASKFNRKDLDTMSNKVETLSRLVESLTRSVDILSNKINGMQNAMGDPGNVLKNIEVKLDPLLVKLENLNIKQPQVIIPSSQDVSLISAHAHSPKSTGNMSVISDLTQSFIPAAGALTRKEETSMLDHGPDALKRRGLNHELAHQIDAILKCQNSKFDKAQTSIIEQLNKIYDLNELNDNEKKRAWINNVFLKVSSLK